MNEYIYNDDAATSLGCTPGTLAQFSYRLRDIRIYVYRYTKNRKHIYRVGIAWPLDVIEKAKELRHENKDLGVASAIEQAARFFREQQNENT